MELNAVIYHILSQAKRKKASVPEKPAKKQKSGETSKPSGSSKSDKNNSDNMFQVQITFPQIFTFVNYLQFLVQ